MIRMSHFAYLTAGLVLLGVVLGSLWFFMSQSVLESEYTADDSQYEHLKTDAYHVTTVLDRQFFDEAFDRAPDFGDRPESRVWILPHHLVPRELIAGFLQTQAAVKTPKTIVVIGPDHLDRASSSLVTTNQNWRTPYGLMEPDHSYVEEITKDGLVTLEPEVFDEEHAVSALVPLLHKQFPKAKIVPLLIRGDVDKELRYKVADILADDMVVAVASVDFSHYLPSDIAELHDHMSRRVLEQRDYRELDRLEIDSPASLAFAFDFAEQTASEEFDFYVREDSDSFFGYPVHEGTSYILGGYTHIEQPTENAITLLAMGDIMFERFYYRQAERDVFENIQGTEGRFFQGVDLLIGNLEGVIAPPGEPKKEFDFAFDDYYADLLSTYNFDAVSLANNHSLDQGSAGYSRTVELLAEKNIGTFGHQTKVIAPVYTKQVGEQAVGLVGINLTHPGVEEEEVRQVIQSAQADHDLVAVFVHWGQEYELYPSESQKQWGRNFVDWGADAVIGAHPHVVQGMEVYNEAPILWSLGNFVFDQDFSIETQYGLVAGLSFATSAIEVYPMPVKIENYHPRLATTTKQIRLDAFIERSELPEEYIVRDGDTIKITIPRS